MFQSMVGREWRATKTAGPLGAPTVLRIVGGDGGSRTPVQNPRSSASYERSRHLNSSHPIPPTGLIRVSLTVFDDFAQANFIIAALLG